MGRVYFIFPCLISVFCLGASWDYTDTSSWTSVDSKCGGTSQSPIALAESTMTSATYQAFSITGDDVTLTETMTNNGHTGKYDLFYFFTIFENAEIEIETEMS